MSATAVVRVGGRVELVTGGGDTVSSQRWHVLLPAFRTCQNAMAVAIGCS